MYSPTPFPPLTSEPHTIETILVHQSHYHITRLPLADVSSSSASPLQFPPDLIATLQRERPDALLIAQDADYNIAARIACWWSDTPPLAGHRVGILGHFDSHDDTAGIQLLEHACRELAAHGCTFAVGPMNGNTWRNYRLVIDSLDTPPFFLEPQNPRHWPSLFTSTGFSVAVNYFSALDDNLAQANVHRESLLQKLHLQGISLAPLDMTRLDSELNDIYEVTLASFADNDFFTPLSHTEFLDQYLALRPLVRPELILLARQNEKLIGFVFGIPDLLQSNRGQPVDTLIVKTLALLPEYRRLGIGSLLVSECHAAAHRLGFRQAIHALMSESSIARNISRHSARIIRRYALFSRPLEELR
ncbi:MAG: GNAT family N-acetyltransferase [Planctomycetaceae bacterium]|nr:GNAT family N-acetyltransferase [Planctomycetaceae bacterium]